MYHEIVFLYRLAKSSGSSPRVLTAITHRKRHEAVETYTTDEVRNERIVYRKKLLVVGGTNGMGFETAKLVLKS